MISKVVARKSTLILFYLIIFQSSSNNLSYPQINSFSSQDETKDIKYDQIDSGRFEGYNLYVVQRYDGITWRQINSTLLITDLNGNIYFSKELPTYSVSVQDAEFINSTTILHGDKDGAILWNLETNKTKYLNFDGHHEYEKNYANDTYFSLSLEPIEVDGETYLHDRIVEYDENGVEVWSASTSNFVSHTHWCPYEDMTGFKRDLTHSNSIVYDDVEDVIYLNVRNTNTFYKIDHKTGEAIWGLGEFGNFTLYDINGIERDILFYHTHSLEQISDNKFIMFDNDEHNQTDNTNHHSRLLEITIDEDKMFANISWEWIAPTDYFSAWYGDCDLLPNNNYFGNFGAQTRSDPTYCARLVEVNTEGEIVWEFSYERVSFNTFGIYRVERFRFEPIVSEPTYYSLGENDGYLEWDVWYNFRTRTEFEGRYYISLDNSLVENGTIEFPRFWKSTKVRYNISPTDYAENEVSLIVSDEAGHLSNETDRYEPIGSLSSENVKIIGISIIGVAAGVLVALLSFAVYVVWRKLIKKKPLFKRKK